MSGEPRGLTRQELRQFPLPAFGDGGKTEHGRLVVVAGSRYTPGSAFLSATAALRSGVGQVTVIIVESSASALSMRIPEAKVVPVAEAPDGGFTPDVTDCMSEHVKSCTGVVAGPGIVENEAATDLARTLLELPVPAIIDAGLLYSVQRFEKECRGREAPAILLPHKVEMEALLGCTVDEAEQDGLGSARQASDRFKALVLAKGAVSHIAAPDGRSWTYDGGAPGLGIAGSGDTLAGITGALLARGAEPLTALLWGVLLHGEAGEMLSAKVGPAGFLARELADEIPALLAR
ncbi:MAG: NAD(P)H-hydrate dehydratase [Sphingomicrobium sp.]